MLIRTFQKAGFTEGDKWRRIEHRCWRVQAKGLQGKPREPWTLAKEPDPRVPGPHLLAGPLYAPAAASMPDQPRNPGLARTVWELNTRMRAVFAYENREFADAIRYSAETLLSVLGIELTFATYAEIAHHGDLPLLISYGKRKPRSQHQCHVHIAESALFSGRFLSPESMPSAPPLVYERLPIVYSSSGAPVTRTDRQLDTKLDLIASTFFMASRYEEFLLPDRDALGRFEARSSFALQQGFLDRPVIDEYGGLVQSWLRELGLPVERKPATRTCDFAICLTHDVDQVSGGWLESILHELKGSAGPIRSVKGIFRILMERSRHHDQYWTFDRILDLEEAYKARSSFYFLAKTKHRMDARYDVYSERFRALFARLRQGGWEVGLHGSFDSVLNDGSLGEERKALEMAAGDPVIGGRQHYLRFDVRDGWHKHQEAGLLYDTSLGFADAVGFRGGLSRPFRVFDLRTRCACSLWEVPLVIMDTTMRNYMKLPVEQVWDHVVPVLEKVKRHRGAVAILWHNTYFAGYKFAGYGEIYERIIRWVNDNGGLCTAAGDIVNQWEDGYGGPRAE